MARQRQHQLVLGDAAPVISDGDALHAAFFEPHRDLGRARVERVFQQFLDHGGRPFHHLAGGDLRNQLIGQSLDRAVGRGGGVHAPDYNGAPRLRAFPCARLSSEMRLARNHCCCESSRFFSGQS
jgi:hypothetical protein